MLLQNEGHLQCVSIVGVTLVIARKCLVMQTNETRRSNKLWRWHVNSTAHTAQELIYTEADEAFELSLTHTRSRKYILLYGQSEVTRYLLYLSAYDPTVRRLKGILCCCKQDNEDFFTGKNSNTKWVILKFLTFWCIANFTVLGPRVHGRKYIHAADWADSWILLVSDMQRDTLNTELVLLPAANTTDLKQLGYNTTLTRSEAGHVAANSSLVSFIPSQVVSPNWSVTAAVDVKERTVSQAQFVCRYSFRIAAMWSLRTLKSHSV